MLATAAALLAAAPAGAQERVLATEQRPTDVAAWGGDAVWSSFDPATASYRLVRSHDGGAPTPLPVAPRPSSYRATGAHLRRRVRHRTPPGGGNGGQGGAGASPPLTLAQGGGGSRVKG